MIEAGPRKNEALQKLELRYSIGVGEDVFSGAYNAYLGISFSKTRYFSARVVRHYADWSLQRFGHLLIIIADHLEIHNQIIFKERSYEEAAMATRRAAEQYRTAYRRAMPAEYAGRLEIALASELLSIPACGQLTRQVHALYQRQADFYEAVSDTVFYALEGKLDECYSQGVPGEVMNTLGQYFIEELGIILYLTEVSVPPYHVSIFPYPPPELLVDFYGGHYTSEGLALPGQLPRPYQALQVVLSLANT